MDAWRTLFEGAISDRLVKVEMNGGKLIRVKVQGHDRHAEVPVFAYAREKLMQELVRRGLFSMEDAGIIAEYIPGINGKW